MDWRPLQEVLGASDGVYSELKNLCFWNKDNAGMGSFYRSQHELVFVFKAGAAPHINNFGLGERVRFIFQSYLRLGSIHRLMPEPAQPLLHRRGGLQGRGPARGTTAHRGSGSVRGRPGQARRAAEQPCGDTDQL